MNVRSYFKSLSEELQSLKNRVRNFIDDAHWLTDGEWKESVLRHFLRRNLPDTIKVGRGFIIDAKRVSHQIDILIYDASKPMLFRDGDLVFVTPDVVNGIIEVKTSLNPQTWEDALKVLCLDAKLMRSHGSLHKFAAIFSFDIEHSESEIYLDILARIADIPNKTIDFAAIGDSKFIKYWNENPKNPKRLYYRWHSYQLDGLAPGYFLHNVVDVLNPECIFRNSDVWFPAEAKEPYRDGVVCASWCREDI